MFKKLIKVAVIFQAATLMLCSNIYILIALQKPTTSTSAPVSYMTSSVTSSQTPQVLGTSIGGEDGRSLIVKNFIQHYQRTSPFVNETDSIVKFADAYGIDYRLVPAIAMCESNLGVKIPSSDSFNAWGIAVYTGKNFGKKFNDWPHAIEWVTKFIKEKFHDKGIYDLKEIGAIWAPPSVAKGYSWTNCVTRFMEEMK